MNAYIFFQGALFRLDVLSAGAADLSAHGQRR